MKLIGTMKINPAGHLEIGGVDTLDLASDFGTPLYVIDEAAFRRNCREIKNAFDQHGPNEVLYASKALCTAALCAIVKEEGLGLDVVSGGELFTALSVDFPRSLIYFHGNNKTADELKMAVEAGIGTIVVDNFHEMKLLDSICRSLGKKQAVMLRISPGIEAHTHEYIKTGQIDSKFGFTLPNGQAMTAVKALQECDNLTYVGIHCHIGSQIFELESFAGAADVMISFVGAIHQETGWVTEKLNLGGGFGIYYTAVDEPRPLSDWAGTLMPAVRKIVEKQGLAMPKVIVEPGRSIVAPAGTTLYTVGSSKDIPGIRKYVAVDGGMGDNPRPALYESKYEAYLANKMNETAQETVTVAGKCCESGDWLLRDLAIPKPEAGDILVVASTGAYNYAMSMNYNRIGRPAMVLVGDGNAEVIIKRETYQDLLRNDVVPDRLK
ncbi:MAG: diaminopimelate decarboxylase [Solirubrobacterales bacterium]